MVFKMTEDCLFTGCRLTAVACRALSAVAEGSANGSSPASTSGIMESPDENEASNPDELRLIAVATGLLCQSVADPAAAMETWLQSSLKRREAKLAKFKVAAMRELPNSQQSSAALRVIAAWYVLYLWAPALIWFD